MRRLLSWSGGKDAAYALLAYARPVDALLVTYDETRRAIPVHDVPLSAIEAQAASLDVPLMAIPLPARCPNDVYVARVGHALTGVDEVVFGDVSLADVREWRKSFLAKIGVRAMFPLWGRDAAELARAIIASGIRAVVCAVDGARLDKSFVGRPYDERLLADLPQGVDPCGENGEFHTFVTDAPSFRAPITSGGRSAAARPST